MLQYKCVMNVCVAVASCYNLLKLLAAHSLRQEMMCVETWTILTYSITSCRNQTWRISHTKCKRMSYYRVSHSTTIWQVNGKDVYFYSILTGLKNCLPVFLTDYVNSELARNDIHSMHRNRFRLLTKPGSPWRITINSALTCNFHPT
jgi:hypothetical protein